MPDHWHLMHPDHRSLEGQAFGSLAATFAVAGETVATSRISMVVRTTIGRQAYYIKTYTAGGKHLRRWIGRSRVQAEWENLLFFERLGIPTPRLVAYGKAVRGGVFQRGAIVTAAVPDAMDLERLALDHHPCFADRAWVVAVSDQLAHYTRRLHDHRFGHLDLKWRNILVSLAGPPRVYFIDCPAGCRRRGPAAGRWFIKDLACLDRDARNTLSRTQRLRFYLTYRRRPGLEPAEKRRIRRILHFYRGRK